MMFDVFSVRQDFPILSRKVHGKPLVYLDNAATSQKPRVVIDAMTDYYFNYNANIHRGIHTLSEEATSAFELTRKSLAKLINANHSDEIVLTANSTEAINMVAFTWGRKNIGRDDEMILTEMEHHANLIPWQVLTKEQGASLKYLEIDQEGKLQLEDLPSLITEKTKLIAVSHVSNVLGTINPIRDLVKKVRSLGGEDIKVLVDGAQSVPHLPIDVQALGCDFLVFSGHKMVAPTGAGVLWAKKEILEEMPPFLFGGAMILRVTKADSTWAGLPNKFAAGTPDIGGVIGLSAAIDYLTKIGMDQIREHERMLTGYSLQKLSEVEGLTIYGPLDKDARGGVISFTLGNIHAHDVATLLDQEGIAIRSGHHCCMPLHEKLGVPATARASFYFYNTKEEVDRLVAGLLKVRQVFK